MLMLMGNGFLKWSVIMMIPARTTRLDDNVSLKFRQ